MLSNDGLWSLQHLNEKKRLRICNCHITRESYQETISCFIVIGQLVAETILCTTTVTMVSALILQLSTQIARFHLALDTITNHERALHRANTAYISRKGYPHLCKRKPRDIYTPTPGPSALTLPTPLKLTTLAGYLLYLTLP